MTKNHPWNEYLGWLWLSISNLGILEIFSLLLFRFNSDLPSYKSLST